MIATRCSGAWGRCWAYARSATGAAGTGWCRRGAEAVLAASAVLAGPTVAVAAPGYRIDIAAGRLGQAVIALGSESGSSIGVGDARLARLATPAVHGRMSVDKALSRLLRGQPAAAERIDAFTWRIVPSAARLRNPARPPQNPAAPDDVARPAEIVVTAGKRAAPLATYPGSAIVLGADRLREVGGRFGGDALVALLPTVGSTELGPGRNKLFIRGIADSSFTGPTQATVSEYLGDVRLTYNAPDPDLRLYDVSSVEVLEGPQGALYGAGSLGGIVRIMPNPVALDTPAGAVEVGRSATAHGADGGDVSAMLNLPVAAGLAGVRGVAYRVIDGGYIDDLGRGRRDVNRTRTVGARLTARVALAGGWTVDVGAALQNIDSNDSQYAERGLPPLTRATNLAQPFDNDYSLGDIVVAGPIGGARFVSTTSLVRHVIEVDDDFTPAGGARRLFRQKNAILLAANETRLSRTDADGGGWIVGASLVSDTEKLTRELGPPADLPRIAGVRNDVIEGAVFGTWTHALLPRLFATAGARLSLDHLSGDPLDAAGGDDTDVDRSEHRLLPTFGLSWQWRPAFALFARYERGFRPGGLSAFGDDDMQGVQRFRSDAIGTLEAGARLGSEDRPVSVTATASWSRWTNIQADLIDTSGLPLTANVGNGRVIGFEARMSLRPARGLRLDGSLFVNDSKLLDPEPGYGSSRGDELPNVAHLGARLAVTYTAALGPRTRLDASLSGRYIGRSRLGAGDRLDLPQGNTFETDARARLGRGPAGLTVGIENLLDERGNQFAFGNPYDVADGRQITPLRPRTVRVGLDARF